MALTKHEKLARAIKRVVSELDVFYEKVAIQLNLLQFYFSETHVVMGYPLMPENVLATMMWSHRCGMPFFSTNEELKEACAGKPWIGYRIRPACYPKSRVLCCVSENSDDAKGYLPWRVQTMLPSESITKLQESRLKALLYWLAR